MTDGTGRVLHATERALAELANAADQITHLPEEGPSDWLLHRTASACHHLLSVACAAQRAGVSLLSMREAASEARRFLSRHSSLIAHSQLWPRGYPGDFEMVERIVDAAPEGEPERLGHALDTWVLGLPATQQHRNKVAWQAELVRKRLADREALRVASIACGGSRDLCLLGRQELARLDLVLVDHDAGALTLSESRLSGAVHTLTCLHGNALRSANRLRALGPFDVVLIGGLLDYLPQRSARSLLEHVVVTLAPEGALGATNLVAGHPWLPLLSLVGSWDLIARDESEMAALLDLPGVSAQLRRDGTGLAWLAAAWR